MIDTNDSEFLSRIEDKSLLSKVMPGAAAAAMINAGDIIGYFRIYAMRLSENYNA